jgi:hypothetical protein
MKKTYQNRVVWLAVGLLTILSLILSACGSSTPAVSTPAPTQAGTAPQAATPQPTAPGVEPANTPLPTAALEPGTSVPLLPVGGIEMHNISERGGLEVVKSTGAYWLRLNGLRWGLVEPQEGVRNWEAVAALEPQMIAASEAGLELILIIRSAPAWAQQIPGRGCGPVAEDKLPAFAQFMQDVVARYSAPPFNVRYWELGNEPDIDPQLVDPDSIYGCWGNAADEYYGGGYYGQMLQSVYPAVKAADPGSQVVVGSLLMNCNPDNPPEQPRGSGNYVDCSPGRFLEGILRAGGADFFDVVGFHAYDYYYGIYGAPRAFGNDNWFAHSRTTGPSLIPKTRFLRAVLEEYGAGDKALVNTETALICTGDDSACQVEDFENVKAYYAAQAYAAAAAEGLLANLWYSITGWRGSGLVGAELTPLPVTAALTASLERLGEAQFVRQITDYPEVMGYEFQKDGRRWWVIWGLAREAVSVTLPSTPQALEDVYGEPLPAAAEIQLTEAPVYIWWEE